MKYILIDTKNLDLDNKYNFRYELNLLINITKYIELQLLVCPRMNFVINSSNNTFQVKLFKDDINYFVNFTLPMLNFTPLSLCDTINLLFSAPNGITLNASYNLYNYKITFTSNVEFELNLTLSLFHKIISLEKIVYFSDINKLISSFIIFNQPNYIKFNINNLSSTNIINNNLNIETLWIVPVINKNFGEIIEYKSRDYPIQIETNIKTNYLDISILDDDGNVFDNNNYNWIAILKFE